MLYGSSLENTILYGSETATMNATNVKVSFSVRGKVSSTVQVRYGVKQHYTGLEPSIEDIYCRVTDKVLSLQFFHGPAFPYRG